jgi:hypothetical protein
VTDIGDMHAGSRLVKLLSSYQKFQHAENVLALE